MSWLAINNLDVLARAHDETRRSFVASLDNDPAAVDRDHRYVCIRRVDVLDGDSGNYRSFRWLTVVNESDTATGGLVHQECGENKTKFPRMRVVARARPGDPATLPVSSLTRIQPNFRQTFRIGFPKPLEPGATAEVFYQLTWPGELHAYAEGAASQSVSLTRYERGVTDLQFTIFDTRGIGGHCMSAITPMYEEIRFASVGVTVTADDEPDIAVLAGRPLKGVRYDIREPVAVCYRVEYTIG